MHPKDVFELNPETEEPFLRLPKPHENLILTPPRLSDADAIVQILNDPRVYITLEGPPYPYLHEHAISWLTSAIKGTDKAWSEILGQDMSKPDPSVFGESPVRILREVNLDGSQTYLGDCNIDRWGYPDVLDEEERQLLVRENDLKSVGDETIIWMFGDYISTTHHGRGIMTAAVRCIIEKWAVPWMAVRHMRTTAHKGNIGSVRVFEKNGFVLEKTLEEVVSIPESKGGGKVGLHILDWKYKGDLS